MATVKKYLALAGAAVIAALGVLVYFFKSKADKAETAAILGETKGRDTELKAAEELIVKKIEEVKSQDDSKLSKEDRAKRWEN